MYGKLATVILFALCTGDASAQQWLRTLIQRSNGTIDVEAFPGEQCLRRCDGTLPRPCYFKWAMEHYQVMGPACRGCSKGKRADCFHPACLTADGVERGVMSLNKKIPGPPIHVCRGDLIVVDITNAMAGTAATIHWHGLHQRATPHMDGVPYLTQCPIAFSDTFRYAYLATEPGTQFYHSHSGHHKVNGHYGALIVRQPVAEDPNRALYDYDLPQHVLVGSDWMHVDAEMFMPGLPSSDGILPVNLLINGKGTFRDGAAGGERTAAPLEVFRVRQDDRYRFRFINAASHVCPLQLQIENHTFQIIASDSFHLQPLEVDTLVSTSGERYDFILRANQPTGNYWVRLRSMGPCEHLSIEQFAVLSYTRETREQLAFPTREPPPYDQPYEEQATANHPNATCNAPEFRDYCITDFKSYDTDESVINGEPDHSFIFGFFNHRIDFDRAFAPGSTEHYMNIHDDIMLQGSINNISLVYPPFPLLTQPEDIDESMFCTSEQRPERCESSPECSCTHRVKIKLGALVELYILDLTPMVDDLNHPFHLHGYQMYVMEIGQDRKRPITIDIARKLSSNRRSTPQHVTLPPRKDTVSIPSKGFARVRLRADNPGFWLMHCHYEWHTAVGMALILQVGETDQMVRPPADFPRCNSYKPALDETLLPLGMDD